MTDSSSPAPASASTGKPVDPALGMQIALFVDILLRLSLWSSALAVTLWLAARWNLWPRAALGDLVNFRVAWDVSQRIAKLVLIYNVAYLVALLAMRLLVMRPRPGRMLTGGKPDPRLVFSLMLGILTKARYQAPFPAFLVQPLASIPPFRWLFNLQFGPNSGSIFFIDPQILDPTAVRVGRNVTIGFGTTITAHLQDRDGVDFRPVVIEDDVLIGGYTAIPAGVHIKRGAIIRGFSLVLPGTVIGENEYWAGIPARKMREMPPVNTLIDTPPATAGDRGGEAGGAR